MPFEKFEQLAEQRLVAIDRERQVSVLDIGAFADRQRRGESVARRGAFGGRKAAANDQRRKREARRRRDRLIAHRHVDQNQSRREMRAIRGQRLRRDQSPSPRGRDDGARPHLRQDSAQILDMRSDIARFYCRGTWLDIDDAPPRQDERFGRRAPDLAPLPRFGEQQDRGIIFVTQNIGGQTKAAKSLIFDDSQAAPSTGRRVKRPAGWTLPA